MPDPHEVQPAAIEPAEHDGWLDQIAANANELVRVIEQGHSVDMNSLITTIVADRKAA